LTLTLKKASAYDNEIIRISSLYGNSPALVRAIIQVESNFNPQAINKSDREHSVGLGQINLYAFPEFTEEMLLNPENNITAVNAIIKGIRERYHTNNPAHIASAYNMGHLKILSSGRFANQEYVDKVLKNL